MTTKVTSSPVPQTPLQRLSFSLGTAGGNSVEQMSSLHCPTALSTPLPNSKQVPSWTVWQSVSPTSFIGNAKLVIRLDSQL